MYPQGYGPPPGYPQGYPPGYPQGPYGGGYPPPPPPRQGLSGLAIGLIIGSIVLVLGFGGCVFLFVLGAAISAEEPDAPVGNTSADPSPAPIPTTTGPNSDTGRAIETSLRGKGIPVSRVICPPGATGTYTCELVITNGDRADLSVVTTPTGVKYEAKDVAFLDGTKLDALFQNSAGKADPNLKVPCFSGILMKRVGSTFTCDVLRRGQDVGDVTVNVKTTDGRVGMKYTVKK